MTPGQPSTQRWDLAIDETTGAAIPRPPRWERQDMADAAIVLVEPHLALDRSFRSNVAVVVERPHDALAEIAAYTTRMVDNATLGLTDLHVIDLDVVEVAGQEGRRMLAGYRSGQYALALEQWWTVSDGVATTLSATCAVEHYLHAAPVFQVVADGLVPARRTA